MSQQQQVRLLVVLIVSLLLGVSCRWWITIGPGRGELVWIGAPLIGKAQAAKLPEEAATELISISAVEAEEVAAVKENGHEKAQEESDAHGVCSSGLLDLNAATQQDLERLPGIGPVLARNILDERARRGGLRSVADLLSVKGIGAARYARIAPLVCVAPSER